MAPRLTDGEGGEALDGRLRVSARVVDRLERVRREGQDDDGDLGGSQQHLWAVRVGVGGECAREG